MRTYLGMATRAANARAANARAFQLIGNRLPARPLLVLDEAVVDKLRYWVPTEHCPMSTFAIDCQSLHKTYASRPPVHAVRGVDLQVAYGECFGVLGPNGAGKTTTIEILEGLLPASSGEVKILGRQWAHDANEIRQRIGVSLQETVLSDDLTVTETLRLFRSFYRRAISVERAIKSVSLEEKAHARVHKLSGGQKQRLAVACALISDPELLFLDEPTTGLDPTSRREVWEIISGLRAQGRTVLLTTHYMDEASRLCDRVAIFDEGRVIAAGRPEELVRSLGGQQMVRFSLTLADDPQSVVDLDPVMLQRLHAWPSVSTAEVDGDRIRVACNQLHEFLPALMEFVRNNGYQLSHLATHEATLDDVFIHLTGKRLAAEGE